MIAANNSTSSTRTLVSSDGYSLPADTTPPKGAGEGFRPHELLEAALASCTAITLRLVAEARGIPLRYVKVTIDLDRADPAKSVFRAQIEFDDQVTESDRKTLMAAARLCPVRKTLSKPIAFDEIIA